MKKLMILIVCFLPSFFAYGIGPPKAIDNLPSFYCIGNQTAGYHYDRVKKQWLHTKLSPPEKVRITPVGTEYLGVAPYTFSVLPGTSISGDCENGFVQNGFIENDKLICTGEFYHLRFSKSTNRFMLIYTSGYWNVPKGKEMMVGDTPAMTIGECIKTK